MLPVRDLSTVDSSPSELPYEQQGNQVTVVFQVKENKGGQSPVVFDNFVWFTDEELNAAIKREVLRTPVPHRTPDEYGRHQACASEPFAGTSYRGHVDYAPEQAGFE